MNADNRKSDKLSGTLLPSLLNVSVRRLRSFGVSKVEKGRDESGRVGAGWLEQINEDSTTSGFVIKVERSYRLPCPVLTFREWDRGGEGRRGDERDNKYNFSIRGELAR